MLRNAGTTRLHTAFHSLLRIHNTATTLTAEMRGFPTAAQNAFSRCRQDGPLFALSDNGWTSIGASMYHMYVDITEGAILLVTMLPVTSPGPGNCAHTSVHVCY